MQALPLRHEGAVRTRTALFFILRRHRQPVELPGKGGGRFFSDGKAAPPVSGKIILAVPAPVFFPKTLPFRKRPPQSPCSSTGCRSPGIHNK